MRKNLCRIAIAAVAAVLSAGCFYESPVPIDVPGSVAFDSSVVGVWHIFEKGDSDTATIVIVGFDRTNYLVHYSEPDKKDASWDGHSHLYLRAHLARIGNARFMNMQVLGVPEPKYWIFRYDVQGNTLKARSLKEGMAERLTTSAQLRAFLQTNLENERIYDDWVELKRVVTADKMVKW